MNSIETGVAGGKRLEYLAALSGANEWGAFCEDCLSPNFCVAKMVEFRSSPIRLRSCGLFEAFPPGHARLD